MVGAAVSGFELQRCLRIAAGKSERAGVAAAVAFRALPLQSSEASAVREFQAAKMKSPSNKRVKYAPFGRPTSKSEALLLAAYARR